MLDKLPEDLHANVGLNSPRTRQTWAQVSRETSRLTRQGDSAFYETWLRDDFDCDSPVQAQPPAKQIYRTNLAVSREETSRLLHLAQSDDIRQFTQGIANPEVQKRLSNRYGKQVLASAGLQMTQRLAAPRGAHDSPPRLRGNELTALEQATRTLHALANKGPAGDASSASFCKCLHDAARQAERQVTQILEPSAEVLRAPARKRQRRR